MCNIISCIKGIQEQRAEGIFEPKRETLTGYTMRDFIIYMPWSHIARIISRLGRMRWVGPFSTHRRKGNCMQKFGRKNLMDKIHL